MDLNAVDLAPKDREILRLLLERYLPHTVIWAYGSRVKGTARPWSDLDLVVFTGAGQGSQVSLLKEALEESNLSFRADLLEWDSLPENFKNNIKTHYAVIAE
ncbi:MAG: nucleotidyltransferase domain-containing protein [Treponema sp.]|nr:nucleotidyltransferase domain-containing protein [Treponema sp.]